MALGFGVLRLSPQHFWSLTLRELEAAVHGLTGTSPATPLARTDLSSLMQRFPDP
jgi:uncharacterized phage protein (TIGR02216 family)